MIGKAVKGYIYRGWQVRYGFDMRKGCQVYIASKAERPNVRAEFTRPRDAQAWIDKQEVRR